MGTTANAHTAISDAGTSSFAACSWFEWVTGPIASCVDDLAHAYALVPPAGLSLQCAATTKVPLNVILEHAVTICAVIIRYERVIDAPEDEVFGSIERNPIALGMQLISSEQVPPDRRSEPDRLLV